MMSRYGESFRMMMKAPCVPVASFTTDQAGLRLMQTIVGGLIESVRVDTLNIVDVDCYCNEDGLHLKLPPNIQLADGRLLVGTLVFCGYDPATGSSVSLTEKQVEVVDTWLSTCKHALAVQ